MPKRDRSTKKGNEEGSPSKKAKTKPTASQRPSRADDPRKLFTQPGPSSRTCTYNLRSAKPGGDEPSSSGTPSVGVSLPKSHYLQYLRGNHDNYAARNPTAEPMEQDFRTSSVESMGQDVTPSSSLATIGEGESVQHIESSSSLEDQPKLDWTGSRM